MIDKYDEVWYNSSRLKKGESMNIGIIDAEIMGKSKHRFPNLACMKLSGYYKELKNNVELLLSYDDLEKYDKVFNQFVLS